MKGYSFGLDVLGAGLSLGTPTLSLDSSLTAPTVMTPTIPVATESSTIGPEYWIQNRKVSKDEFERNETNVRKGLSASRNKVDAATRERAVSAFNMLLVSGLIGGIVGGVGGALLWSSHRFFGFLLGSILLGAPAGYTVGTLLAVNKMKEASK